MDDKTKAQISVMINDLMVAFLRKKIDEHKEYAIFYIQNNDSDTADFFKQSIKEMIVKKQDFEAMSNYIKYILSK